MDLQLQGHKALITGASRGIGRAIAAEFVREGASVAICARQAEALEQARAQLATPHSIGFSGGLMSLRR